MLSRRLGMLARLLRRTQPDSSPPAGASTAASSHESSLLSAVAPRLAPRPLPRRLRPPVPVPRVLGALLRPRPRRLLLRKPLPVPPAAKWYHAVSYHITDHLASSVHFCSRVKEAGSFGFAAPKLSV